MEIADGSQSADHRGIGAMRSFRRVAKDARDGLDLLLSPRAKLPEGIWESFFLQILKKT